MVFVNKTFKTHLLQTAEQNSYVLHTNCPFVSVINVCSDGGASCIYLGLGL